LGARLLALDTCFFKQPKGEKKCLLQWTEKK